MSEPLRVPDVARDVDADEIRLLGQDLTAT